MTKMSAEIAEPGGLIWRLAGVVVETTGGVSVDDSAEDGTVEGAVTSGEGDAGAGDTEGTGAVEGLAAGIVELCG